MKKSWGVSRFAYLKMLLIVKTEIKSSSCRVFDSFGGAVTALIVQLMDKSLT